jgi:eukaryotic-like serine/threonine-protein kinase
VENDLRDEDRLIALASRIDDAQPIDWATAEADARSENERAVLAELRLLAALTQVSRNPDGLEQATELDDRAAGDRAVTWMTLTILEPVGRGGFARVYRAKDKLNREVALKLFPIGADGSSELVTRVLREGSLLARVKHPNVVVVHGVDRSADYVGLWMEFINGRTMEDELRARGTLSAEEATTIGVDLCRALAAVHGRGILHRDVKAQNVMREEGGRTVLMDFGAGSESSISAAGPVDVAGTPLYLAPELFDRQPATRASDIYSLGVLLYRMVTGGYPVEGADRAAIERAHREQRRQRLRDARADLPTGFVQAVERALSPDPSARYQTAAAFEEALTGWMAAPSWFQRTRRAAAIAAVVTLVAASAWFLRSMFDRAGSSDSNTALVQPPPADESAPLAAGLAQYNVNASFYKPGDRDVTLGAGDRVASGDALGLRINASTPLHVYVITVDDRGEDYLLFPIPGGMENPLAAGQTHELPGMQKGQKVYWMVSSVGGREHFLVLASPTPLPAFEPLLKTLPSPTLDKQVSYAAIPDSVIGNLRGVGGLVTAEAARKANSASPWFGTAEPLRAGIETISGPWVRQITLENSGR